MTVDFRIPEIETPRLRLRLSHAYDTLGWSRIVSLIMQDNARSIRLAERMGCQKDGVFAHPVFGRLDIWVHPAPEALQ